jgi:GNAT superfamily N-acetyltransferase
MEIFEVLTQKDWQDFHRVPKLIYQQDPHWIAPLEGDIEAVFDPAVNEAFEEGEAACFVLRDEQGTLRGRIAAFIDHARNKIQQYPIGGIGFFECTEQQEYAFALFDHAAAWLQKRGAAVIDGPINFGEREKFWGLLVRGFAPPFLQENYNPPYYQRFFEAWGFIPFEQILTLTGASENIPVDRLHLVMERLRRRVKVETLSLDYRQLPKFASDFCVIYNAAFSKYGHFKPLKPSQVIKILKEAKPVADPQIMAITYFDGQPAAFCALLPEINELLKFANGRLTWWKIPVLLWKKWRKKSYAAKGIGFGIHPDFQNKGAYAAIVEFMATPRNKKRYPLMVLTTVRAHNHEAVSVYKKLGVEVERIHIAYRKPLKADIRVEPFEFTEKYR